MPVQFRTFALTARVLWACFGLSAWQAMAQVPATFDTLPASAPLASTSAASASAVPSPSVTSKRWQNLTQKQKQALSPLGPQWDSLTAQQQRKWLTISDTFLQLTDEEQMTMHGRMSEWAKLSAKERNAARFNFNSSSVWVDRAVKSSSDPTKEAAYDPAYAQNKKNKVNKK